MKSGLPKEGEYIDPRGRPTVTVGSDHYFHTGTYVRPHSSKYRKTKQFSMK